MDSASPNVLAPRCAVCNSSSNLLRCSGCEVQRYCCKDHQTSDWNSHKTFCSAIKKAQAIHDKEKETVRNFRSDGFMTPDNPFETSVGHFWGILNTRNYMRARYALVEAILKVDTFDAVQSALDHLLDMLRLCRSDNMGVRNQVPGLMLRLGKDQECYDFIKWWKTCAMDESYDWDDMDVPYLNLKDEDVFESVEIYTNRYMDLAHTASIALLKVRLLIDLLHLQASLQYADKVPQEIFDGIRNECVSSIISKRKTVIDNNDHSERIKQLDAQVVSLYKAVKAANKNYWQLVMNPGQSLTARPETYSTGSKAEAELALQYTYKAWEATPGAVDMVKKLSDKYGK